MSQIHFTHLAGYSQSTHAMNSWVQEADEQGEGLRSTAYWKKLVQTLERGLFDGIFFVDVLALAEDAKATTMATVRTGASGFPRLDPLSLLPILGEVTSHLGLAATLSTASVPPYIAARILATIDNITGGRVAWNVVTGHAGADFRALGIELPKHDERYDRADEYIEICYRLWDAFPHEALVLDKKAGVCVDVEKLRKVDYDGKYYKCHAYPIVMGSRQGRPLIFQAGQSGRGMQFAAMHSDAIYSLQPRIGTMEKYMANVRSAFNQYAPTRQPRVFFGVQPFLGGTEAEAKRRHNDLRDNVPIELALDRLSALVGFDFSSHDPDQPLEDIATEGGRGIFAALRDSIEGRTATLREAALFYAISVGMPQVVGTPEQLADWIENAWHTTGCYGFGISTVINPLITEEFVDHVIPILRKRGLVRTEYAGTTFRENLLQQHG